MKHTLVWKIMLALGICPFAAPFVTFLYQMLIQSSFTLLDWLLLYSFVFWWTYVVGLGLIVIAAVHLKRREAGAESDGPQV
ncbi:MAG: hypothetical protein IJ480_00885 [Clostridia bacterium]|nr:hypothetical protein [Clostridia bacterium]